MKYKKSYVNSGPDQGDRFDDVDPPSENTSQVNEFTF